MSTKLVTLIGTFTGIMSSEDDVPKPPLGIWGPSDPRPTNPIFGFDRWTGLFPGGQPPQPPLGFWGPNDPRPTNPIAGFDPIHGTFPPWNPPGKPPMGGMPGQLPASDPSGSGWVFAFVPGYGWGWYTVPGTPVPTPPVTEPPATP